MVFLVKKYGSVKMLWEVMLNMQAEMFKNIDLKVSAHKERFEKSEKLLESTFFLADSFLLVTFHLF